MKPRLLLAVLCIGAMLLSACAQTRLRIEDDFGRAVNQDLVAQIADPDAARNEGAPPPSSGARSNLAMTRYRQDAVTPPSDVGASGTSNGYSNGSSSGTSAPTAAATSMGTTSGP
jgi:hypothetical protein